MVAMRDITKRFGDVVANKAVDFTLREREIHALLGENGAGKTTLMRILYGLYQEDAGQIWVRGEPVAIRSPRDAIALGIGMVTQHFALVPPMTVTENVILGTTDGLRLNLKAAHQKVAAAAERFGLSINPRALVEDLSVGEQQRVEILKALYRHAEVLILDEPTAVLVPQEVEQLFDSLRRLQEQGLSVVFITHKLHEVMAITNRVTVLRDGRVAGTVITRETDQAELARMMVGRATFNIPERENGHQVAERALVLEEVTALNNDGQPALKRVSLTVRAGEVLGLAGVSGNGQAELAEVLSGTRAVHRGRVLVHGRDVTNANPDAIMAAGVGRIPEDGRANVVSEMTVAQNIALEHLGDFTRRGQLDRRQMRAYAQKLIDEYQIKAQPDDAIRTLSGGNLQKVILARVLARHPRVLVVSQPSRGLDVGATSYVRRRLLEQTDQGAGVLLISEDLDEVLALSDRIAVIYEGEIMGVLKPAEATVEQLGLLMAGVQA